VYKKFKKTKLAYKEKRYCWNTHLVENINRLI